MSRKLSKVEHWDLRFTFPSLVQHKFVTRIGHAHLTPTNRPNLRPFERPKQLAPTIFMLETNKF